MEWVLEASPANIGSPGAFLSELLELFTYLIPKKHPSELSETINTKEEGKHSCKALHKAIIHEFVKQGYALYSYCLSKDNSRMRYTK